MTRTAIRSRSPGAGRLDLRLDLRLPVLGATAWAMVALSLVRPSAGAVGLVVGGLGVALLAWWRRRLPVTAGALLVVATGAVAVSGLTTRAEQGTPVAGLALERASAVVTVTVRTQGVVSHARFGGGSRVRFEADLVDVEARGQRYRRGGRVLVLVNAAAAPPVGAVLRLGGRLAPSESVGVVAVVLGRGPPRVQHPPGALDRAVNRVRAAVRTAAAGGSSGAAALVPALVDGDEGAGDGTGSFAEDFRTAGMSHLLAVSGTNLTVILGGLLALAGWCGVRARGYLVVAALGVVGFVLLAGPEPSVLRAAVMGSVAAIGMGRAGPGQGLRALGASVLVLVLVTPPLALALGFALSVVATGGILVLGPPFCSALSAWMPRWAAAAIAVPLAAQLACTPVVALFSGQVSLVAVAANIAAAPLVTPATVLGLLGGLLALVWVPAGRLVAVPACWCADGIIAIGTRAAALPVPAVDGVASWPALVALTAVCLLAARYLPVLLRRSASAGGLAAVMAAAILVPVPTPGWPPTGWVVAACDVGQGDALLLPVGRGSAVVVDTGPEPGGIDRCLRRFGVRRVPVVVLTHFHADHVDGLEGVLRGRRVGRIDVSPLPEPASGADSVRRSAAARGIPVRVVTAGERTTVGGLRWQVLGPLRLPTDSLSPPNDSSVVLLVTVGDVRVLLLGDAEPPAQSDLRRAWPGLRADVLKVSHHGSGKQDHDLIESLGARLAVISVGRDNDYGHPAPSLVDVLRRAGMQVRRTDLDGDVAVVAGPDGRLAVARRGVVDAP